MGVNYRGGQLKGPCEAFRGVLSEVFEREGL